MVISTSSAHASSRYATPLHETSDATYTAIKRLSPTADNSSPLSWGTPMLSVQTGGYTYTATAIHNSSSRVPLYAPFSNASPASVASIRRTNGAAPVSDDDGDDLGSSSGELTDPEVLTPIGESWVLLFLVIGYVLVRKKGFLVTNCIKTKQLNYLHYEKDSITSCVYSMFFANDLEC